MLSNNIFYNETLRRTLVAFGSLFSNIKIKRDNQDGTVSQTIAVPIAMAPKEKWIRKLEEDPTLDNYVYTTLPRLSFEIVGVNYDPSRKLAKTSPITCSTGGTEVTMVYSPVPYNVDINLYALTKTAEDGFQIIEQILPYFGPDFTLSIKGIPGMNVNLDVPIILNNVTMDDQYDGDFQTRRFITWSLSFTLKTNLFGPMTSKGIVNRVEIDISDITGGSFGTVTGVGDTITGKIIWSIF